MNDYDENDDSESKLQPTHWSEMDLKKLKVDELRTELMARDLDTRGLKGRLIARLQEALDAEKVKENFFLTLIMMISIKLIFNKGKRRSGWYYS